MGKGGVVEVGGGEEEQPEGSARPDAVAELFVRRSALRVVRPDAERTWMAPPEDAVQLMNHEFWMTASAPRMRAQPPSLSSGSGAKPRVGRMRGAWHRCETECHPF